MILFEEVAVALSGTFVAQSSHVEERGVILIDGATTDSGPGLWVRRGGWGNEGRIEVSGLYPVDVTGLRCDPRNVLPHGARESYLRHITITDRKSPARIARDIERRFLPGYRDLYAKCRAYADSRNDRNASQVAIRDRLAAVAGDAVRVPNGVRPEEAARRLNGGTWKAGPSFELEIAHDEERVSRLELHNLTVDDAEWILRFLYEGRPSS